MTEPSRENPPLTRRQAREFARTGQIPIVGEPSSDPSRAGQEPSPVPAPRAASTDAEPAAPVPGPGPRQTTEAGQPDTVAFDALLDLEERRAAAAAASSEPPQESTPPVSSGAQAAPASLEDLFAPEREVSVKKKRRGAGCLVAFVIFALIAGGLTVCGFWAWNTYGPVISEKLGWDGPNDFEPGQATGEVLITIESGDDGSRVSNTLFEAGVTLKSSSFYDHLISIGETTPDFFPGVYRLQQKMTSAAAWEALQDPENKLENTVALQEGWTVAGTIEAASVGLDMPIDQLQAAVADPSVYGVAADSLEGWLFPAHYTFDPDTTAQDVIQAMVDRTRESLAAAKVPAGEEQRILTIASIVQREGGSADFGKVARVILNRLDPEISDTDGLLQMDSTAQFGYRQTHPDAPEQENAFSTEEQLADPNPWNTYVHTGLPAGPIANPGDDAIAAAMNPDAGDWQYFVTVDFETGETLFAATLAEHDQNVAKLHAWCQAHPDHAGC